MSAIGKSCQSNALVCPQLNNTFEDKCSGGTRNRPGLDACMKHVRKGNVLSRQLNVTRKTIYNALAA